LDSLPRRSAPAVLETDGSRQPGAGSRAQGGGALGLRRSPPTPPPPSHARHSGLRGAEGDGAPGWGEPGEPPGPVSQAAAPGNAVSASGVPPEERPDLTHRPRAGGGLQEVQLPVLTVAHPPSPPCRSPAPPPHCITAGTLTLGGLLLHAPATTATAEWVIRFSKLCLLIRSLAARRQTGLAAVEDEEFVEGGGPGKRAVCKCSSTPLPPKQTVGWGRTQLGSTALWFG